MITTAKIQSTCPEWCQLQASHMDDKDGHSGPIWPEVPSMHPRFENGFNWASVSVGSTTEGAMVVYIQANCEMTPEQAMQAGRHMIEAGQWALAHQVA